MRSANKRYLNLLLIWLSVTFLGCQTRNVMVEQNNAVPKTEWAAFDLALARNVNNFPSKLFASAVDGEPLVRNKNAKIALRGKMSCKAANSCKFHPGKHTVEVGYVWSKIETVEEQKKKATLEGWTTALIILGVVPEVATYRNSQCSTSIEFEVQATREYALNVTHSDRRRGPDAFNVVDTESNIVVGSQTGCDLLYETALPFSDEPVSSDQCAIHLISDYSHPMTFYLSDSHPYYGYHMSHTLLVEPGKQAIRVRNGRASPTTNSTAGETILIQCDGGEAKYIQIDKANGFWTSKLNLTELSAEEGQLIDKTVLR
jgi:hypothetical protein